MTTNPIPRKRGRQPGYRKPDELKKEPQVSRSIRVSKELDDWLRSQGRGATHRILESARNGQKGQ